MNSPQQLQARLQEIRDTNDAWIHRNLPTHKYTLFLEEQIPLLLALAENGIELVGALTDMQGEHCDTHCGNGQHVSICENASKALDRFNNTLTSLLPKPHEENANS